MILDTTRTWLVAKDGDDGNDGRPNTYPIVTTGRAKLTVNAAVAAAASGDRIIIFPGTYDEAVDVDTADKALTIEGTNREKCIISNAAGGGDGIILESGCVLRNLTVKSGTGTSPAGISVQSKNNFLIENVTAICLSTSGAVDGAKFNNSYDFIVRNSYFTSPWDGAVITGAYRALFEGCSFVTTGEKTLNDARGLIAGSAVYDIEFRNCFFYATRSADVDKDVYACGVGGPISFIGCTFYAKTSGNCNGDAYAVSSSGGSFVGCGLCAVATAGNTAYDIKGTTPFPVFLACSYTSVTPVISGTAKFLDRIVSDVEEKIEQLLSDVESLFGFLEADKVIDTSSSPWVLEFRNKDTKEVMLRQTMKNTGGVAIANANNVLGRLELEED